jgi:predicted metal-dependent peptidase
MDINHKVKRAKIQLVLHHPFFASLLLKLETVVTDKVSRASTDGVTLRINEGWFGGLPEAECLGVLAHEVMHPALLHHTRRGNRNPLLWNYAADYAINPLIKKAGLTLPSDAIDDLRFHGMSAEAIYDIIYDETPKIEVSWSSGDGFKGSCGDVTDFPGSGESDEPATSSEIVAEEMQKIQDLIAANQAHKSQEGSKPFGIERLIEEFLDPKVRWQDHMDRLVSEKSYNDYTWSKPNRRYLGTGFYLPSLEDETYGEVAFMIDASGSIQQPQLDVFAGESNGIASFVQSKKWVIYCDSKVAHVDEFESYDDLEFRPHGGGGTDFRPPFRWLEDNEVEPKIAIYFTDGICSKFPEEPDYPVIWALYDGVRAHNFKPPFGDVVEIPADMK